MNCPIFMEAGGYSIDVEVIVDDQHLGGVDIECTLGIYSPVTLSNGGPPSRSSSDDSSGGNTLSMSTTIYSGEIPSCTAKSPVGTTAPAGGRTRRFSPTASTSPEP